MEIILIRHTSVAVPKSVCYGQSDVPLADTFEAEKTALLDKLNLKDGAAVYSSPAQRCTRLAENISSVYTTDGRLRELDFGGWEMKPWNDIPETELNVWMNDFVNEAPPGGENFAALHKRTGEFLTGILQTDWQVENPQIVLVTHAGVIRSLLCHCLAIPLANAFRLHVDYGFTCRIRYQGGIPSVRF